MELALQYGLMSAYTSFVAIDSQVRNSEGSGTTVAVPVPLPDQVSPLAAPTQAYYAAGHSLSGGMRNRLSVRPRCTKSASLPPHPVPRQDAKDEIDSALVVTEHEEIPKQEQLGANITELRIQGTLNQTDVLKVLKKAIQSWIHDKCLKGFQGTVTLSLEITPGGSVKCVRIMDAGNHREKILSCIQKEAKKLSFLKSGATSHIHVKLSFL